MISVLVGQGQYSFRKRVGTVDYPYTNRKKGCACTKSHPLFCYARPEQMLVQANGINSTYQKVYPKVKSN